MDGDIHMLINFAKVWIDQLFPPVNCDIRVESLSDAPESVSFNTDDNQIPYLTYLNEGYVRRLCEETRIVQDGCNIDVQVSSVASWGTVIASRFCMKHMSSVEEGGLVELEYLQRCIANYHSTVSTCSKLSSSTMIVGANIESTLDQNSFQGASTVVNTAAFSSVSGDHSDDDRKNISSYQCNTVLKRPRIEPTTKKMLASTTVSNHGDVLVLRRQDVLAEGVDPHCDKGLLSFVKAELAKMLSPPPIIATATATAAAAGLFRVTPPEIFSPEDGTNDESNSAFRALLHDDEKLRSLVWYFRGSVNFHRGREKDSTYDFYIKKQLEIRKGLGNQV